MSLVDLSAAAMILPGSGVDVVPPNSNSTCTVELSPKGEWKVWREALRRDRPRSAIRSLNIYICSPTDEQVKALYKARA